MPYSETKRRNHREYLRRRYNEDPEYREKHLQLVRENNKRYKAEVQRLVDDFKKDGCLLCLEREPCCMSAHHLGDKEFSIGEAQRRRLAPKRVLDELNKCVCLCENCHRKVHAGILKLDAGMDTGRPLAS